MGLARLLAEALDMNAGEVGELIGVRAWFSGAQFSGDADFSAAQFSGVADFRAAQFSAARLLGPLTVDRQLSLQQVSFSAPVLIEVATTWLSLIGVDFEQAATLRVRFAEIALDGTSFAKPSTISFAETAFQTDTADRVNDDADGLVVNCPRHLSTMMWMT